MERSYTQKAQIREQVQTYLCAIDDSLKLNNPIGIAVAERFLDLAFQLTERHLSMEFTEEQLDILAQIRFFRNKLTHRYESFLKEHIREQLASARTNFEKLIK